jgi:hypothetical protein
MWPGFRVFGAIRGQFGGKLASRKGNEKALHQQTWTETDTNVLPEW